MIFVNRDPRNGEHGGQLSGRSGDRSPAGAAFRIGFRDPLSSRLVETSKCRIPLFNAPVEVSGPIELLGLTPFRVIALVRRPSLFLFISFTSFSSLSHFRFFIAFVRTAREAGPRQLTT